ncbi:hypothetical protein [Herpetosiphon llansteffanensis]|uniref:hypothetical protein n=1 Tax=Herpetosiphon llansteffanensis TaxID=2094568 RepID=UPI000D7BC9A4|nr:hypothetical protein [Herpetosiphon llansteffanensis]
MNQPPESYPEETLRKQAQAFPYPPTPQLQITRPHRSVWPLRVGVAVAVVLLLSFTLPAVRAHVGRWLQVGTIFIGNQPPTMLPKPTQIQPSQDPITNQLPTSSLLGPPDQLLQLEPYPHVQRLMWFSQAQTITLDVLDSQAWAGKTVLALDNVTRTQVHNQPAIWLQGQRELTFFDPGTTQIYQTTSLSVTATLIWTDDQRTYRLETTSDLATMRQIAESLSQGE